MTTEKTQEDYRNEYRAQLLEYAKESQTSYDKTLITLSGGALGISFAFVDQFISKSPVQQQSLLVTAWTCWIVSLSLILFSFYTSNQAMLRAVRQVDREPALSTNPGGFADRVTALFNLLAGLSFIIGVAAMAWFSNANI